MKRKLLPIISIILAFFLVSCVPAGEESENNPPVADAGEDQYCFCGETVTLNAGGSEDPDEDSLEYEWTVGDKTYTGKELSISFDSQGVYTAYLEVTDGIATDTDSVAITVEPKEEVTEESEDKEETAAWQAKCTRVIDGNTIELETGERVRYIGIDCPGSDDEYRDTATEINSGIVLGEVVTLEKDVSDTDQYGSILAYVYVGDLFVNAYLVENGYAQVATYLPDVKYSDYFLELQEKAIEEGKGFWAEAEEETATTEKTSTIEVVSLTSPIERGAKASIGIETNPNALCTITVYYESGLSQAQGLDPKTSDAEGNCSWSWNVGTNTTPGDWKIVLTAEGAEDKEVTFTVTKTAEEIAQEGQDQQEEQQATYDINIVSLTSPISRGSQASITINTAPNVLCTITVYYKSGPSSAQGLGPKNSDSNGNCSWSWKVGTRTTPGNWRIVLTADGVGQTETTFTVTE